MQQGLGLWLGVRDPASDNYIHRAKLTRPVSVLHTATAPITDQGDVGACVGFTDLDLINTAKFLRSRRRVWSSSRYLPDDLGFSFYSAATREDEWPEEYPPVDVGSSVLGGAKVLKSDGYIDRYEWARDFESFLAALQRQPVMLGTLWTSEMSDPTADGLVRPTGDLWGGHAYMARGVNFRRRRIRCRNHWTRAWGLNGEFDVGFDDMEWLLDGAQQGECVVPLAI